MHPERLLTLDLAFQGPGEEDDKELSYGHPYGYACDDGEVPVDPHLNDGDAAADPDLLARFQFLLRTTK